MFIQKIWKLGLGRVQLDIEFQIILNLNYKEIIRWFGIKEKPILCEIIINYILLKNVSIKKKIECIFF